MDLFLDASAVVPLLLEEIHSSDAAQACRDIDRLLAWDWLKVEVHSALSRRNVTAGVWGRWSGLRSQFYLQELLSERYDDLNRFNKSLRLRSADAGHLYVFAQLLTPWPDLRLLTFDEEMLAAAHALGLPVWTPN